jgi:hypothetical protein
LRSHAAYAAAKRERCGSMTNSAQERLLRSCHYTRAASVNSAAQTRMVSVAKIRLDSRKSVRSFKGIICDDISEFESYMPSHAVGLSGHPHSVREGSSSTACRGYADWEIPGKPTQASASEKCLRQSRCTFNAAHARRLRSLTGARRRYAERLVEVNRLCKLLADEVIAPREFLVCGKRSLDELRLAAA